MVETRGAFSARVLPGIGLVTLWASIAYILEITVVEYIKFRGSQQGIFAPLGWNLYIRPTSVLGAVIFLVAAVAFVRMCARSGLPVWLAVASMTVVIAGFWAWAGLYARDLMILDPDMGLTTAIRRATLISASSTGGICVGMLVAILLARRSIAGATTGF